MSAGARRDEGPSESSSTSETSEPTTSREVLESVYHLERQEITTQRRRDEADTPTEVSSPTASSSSSPSSSDSRSTADIPSEVLTSQDENKNEDGEALDARPESPVERVPSAGGRIHGHLLPSGWACNYYPRTDEYRFELSQAREGESGNEPARTSRDRAVSVRTPTRDGAAQTSRRPTLLPLECQYGYHFPTSPTSSMISELAKQVQKSSAAGATGGAPTSAPKTRQVGYGKHKLSLPSVEEEQARRLGDMFPTATGPVIEQMIRIYHGREGLIKAGLISLGYKRSSEYGARQAAAQSPIMLMMSKPASKKLFDKLVGYFPDKDEALIKGLMYEHKEVEHEIISALVESERRLQPGRPQSAQLESALRLDRSGAIMKLRYLKFLYPTCEEIEIYHLLNCNDLNAQKVMEIVESRGHKQANIEEVLQSRKTQTQQMRAQQSAHAARERACNSARELVQAHVGRTRPTVAEARVSNLKASLIKTLGDLDDGLALGALEAADYNEPLARKFIEERAPVDESLYKQRYEIRLERKPDLVAFPCKAVQKDASNFMSIMANESVLIARQVIECEHALALLKTDAATFTGDDFTPVRECRARGSRPGLRQGASIARRREMKLREPLQVGADTKLRAGAKYTEVMRDPARAAPGTSARGRNVELARGRNTSLRCGHNPELLARVHPFFKAQA